MKLFVFSFALLSLFTSFTNGVRIGRLTGKSVSGRTLFEAELEDMSILNSAKFTVDNDELNLKSSDRCAVIFDPTNKVFTMSLESEESSDMDTFRFIKFWAIPLSFEKIDNEDHSTDSYTFKANIRGKDPRKNRGYSTPIVFLDCKLDYYQP